MRSTIQRLKSEHPASDEGFTLIELIVVVVILGILAAIVVVAVGNTTSTSAQASCQADYKSVEVAAESFKAQVGAYPGSNPNSFTINNSPSPAIPATYMKGVTSTALTGGIAYLLPQSSSDTDNNTPANNIGPWLKDLPFNNGHYQIALSSDAADTISVYNTATPAPADLGSSITACQSVK